MEKCYENLLKYFVFLCNLIFALAGACLVGFGAYVQINSGGLEEFIGSSYVIISTFVIVVGLITFFISFVGCCGSCNENSCMVYTYSGLLLLILLAEFGAGIAALVLRADLGTSLDESMKGAMAKYNDTEAATGAWDLVQSEFHCCGLRNSSDWSVKGPPEFHSGVLPQSCCDDAASNCTVSSDQVYSDGCEEAVNEFLETNIDIIGVVALSFGLIEIVGLVLACCLGDRIHRAKHYHRFD